MKLKSTQISSFIFLFYSFYWYPFTVFSIGGGVFSHDLSLFGRYLRLLPILFLILYIKKINFKASLFVVILLVYTYLISGNSVVFKSFFWTFYAYQICSIFHKKKNEIETIRFVSYMQIFFIIVQLFGLVKGPADYSGVYIRFVGSFGGPNLAGGILSMFAIYWFELYRISRSKTYFYLFIIMSFLTLYTVSLSAIVSLCIVLMINYSSAITTAITE